MYTFAEENYLKAIYKLSELDTQAVSTNAIADLLQTKAASVTDMIKKLSDKRLLKYEKYKGVELTDKGKKIAIETVRKHRLWECFLYDKLKFGWDEVHEIAEQLEHIQSEVLVDKLDEFLEFPTHDPHGDPIPGKNGIVKKTNFILLSELELDKKAIMAGVVDHSSVFLQYLNKLEITLGIQVQLVERNEYDGSIEIQIQRKKLHLSKEVAKNILVKLK
ncbi:MAG: metal-dependent transcriptional regulator [Bacteroidia bacterium]|jgi:DtxR family Mn-dependent transcriptional regulator|nr:metal-dependent transcriptional regulator [Bacteroidia bacterium]